MCLCAVDVEDAAALNGERCAGGEFEGLVLVLNVTSVAGADVERAGAGVDAEADRSLASW